MSCDKKPTCGAKADDCCGTGGSFFGTLFGMGGGEKDKATGSCDSCGNEKCNCQCELKKHLRECCGYGQRAKLIECCDEVKSPGGGKCCGSEGPKTCEVNKNKCDVCPKTDTCNKCEAEVKKNDCDDCPPLPESKYCGEKPCWLCPPPDSCLPNFPAPCGVEILPISVGGRIRKGTGCGSSSDAGAGLNKDCPMAKVLECGGGPNASAEAASAKSGFFASLGSLFGGKK